MSKRRDGNAVTLNAWGGLGGQLLALSYALWISRERERRVHLKFHDGGTSYRPVAIASVLHCAEVESHHITYEEVQEYTKQRKNSSGLRGTINTYRTHALHLLGKLRKKKIRGETLAVPDITLEILKTFPRSTQELLGYTTDYRVVEETYDTLARCLEQTEELNFLVGAGTQESVAIHWRLGDYIGNEFHGAIPLDALVNAVASLDLPPEVPRTIYTDSPEYAHEQLSRKGLTDAFTIQSNSIWQDLYDMSRAKYFIGNHSGISMLSALAVHRGNPKSEVLFPDKWFLNENDATRFHPPAAYSAFKNYDSLL